MAGDTTRLVFELFGRDHASPVFDKFGRRVRDTAKDVHFLSSATKGLLAGFASYATIGAATNFLKEANAEARESQKVNALTANALRTTGAAAWESSAGVSALATAISNKTAVDDEAVQTGSNLLLTFKQVRNEAGAGADIFNRATAAAVDLSASGFGSIDSAAKMLGKSLNDPVKGVTALTRAGVTFTAQQKTQIADLVKHSDLLGAQKIILKEVESQVKGSAAAQATAGDRLTVAYKNAQEVIGTALLPLVDDLSNALADRAGPAAEDFAGFLTSEGIPALKDFYAQAKPVAQDVLPAIGDAAGVVLDVFKVVAPLVGDVAKAFSSLPEAGQQAILLGAGVAMMGRQMSGTSFDLRNLVQSSDGLGRSLDTTRLKAMAIRGGIGAAGIGLSSFSDELDDSVSGLGATADALGMAATGFAVGGPWGAAVGAGVGLLKAFGHKNRDVIGDVSALTATLDTQSGAITKNTRQWVVNELSKKHNGESTFSLGQKVLGGGTEGLITDAALGNKAAKGEIAAGIDVILQNAGDAGTAPQDSPEGRQALALAAALGITSEKLREARREWDATNNASKDSIELNKLSADQIKAVGDATDGIPDKVITQFTQPGFSGAVDNAVSIAKKYKLTPKQVITALEALDYSSPKIAKVLKGMGLADKDVVTALKATDLSTKKINQILAALRKLKDKNIKINTTYTYSGMRGGAGRGSNQVHSADGNIFEAFEDGGMSENHVAQIGDGAVSRVWNEPETHGEGYVPFAPSKIVRSRAITQEIARRLGGTAEFENGGTHGSRSMAGGAGRAVPVLNEERLVRMLSRSLADALDGLAIKSDSRGNLRFALKGA